MPSSHISQGSTNPNHASSAGSGGIPDGTNLDPSAHHPYPHSNHAYYMQYMPSEGSLPGNRPPQHRSRQPYLNIPAGAPGPPPPYPPPSHPIHQHMMAHPHHMGLHGPPPSTGTYQQAYSLYMTPSYMPPQQPSHHHHHHLGAHPSLSRHPTPLAPLAPPPPPPHHHHLAATPYLGAYPPPPYHPHQQLPPHPAAPLHHHISQMPPMPASQQHHMSPTPAILGLPGQPQQIPLAHMPHMAQQDVYQVKKPKTRYSIYQENEKTYFKDAAAAANSGIADGIVGIPNHYTKITPHLMYQPKKFKSLLDIASSPDETNLVKAQELALVLTSLAGLLSEPLITENDVVCIDAFLAEIPKEALASNEPLKAAIKRIKTLIDVYYQTVLCIKVETEDSIHFTSALLEVSPLFYQSLTDPSSQDNYQPAPPSQHSNQPIK